MTASIDLRRHHKIEVNHLDRLAIVYVRQSTLAQLQHHQESTQMQYALVHHAADLGWAPDRVLVIDDDQGKSGTTAIGRPGFTRLVTEVSLGHVGLILGTEMSRLARSNRDWHHLLEVCALFQTLIGDVDGIYNPADYNDRLLLGLKGTMSEAELHILKNRMNQLTSCSLSFQDEQCVLEGIEGLQLKFECLPTDLRHEREPYGPRQIAPIRPGAWRLDRQRQVLQMA